MIDKFEAQVTMAVKNLELQMEALKMHHAQREFERGGIEHKQKIELMETSTRRKWSRLGKSLKLV